MMSRASARRPCRPPALQHDEESSGIIEVTDILGDADTKAYLVDVQAHYNIPGELVQGGQLGVMYVDEVKDGGAGDDRVAGDARTTSSTAMPAMTKCSAARATTSCSARRGNDTHRRRPRQ